MATTFAQHFTEIVKTKRKTIRKKRLEAPFDSLISELYVSVFKHFHRKQTKRSSHDKNNWRQNTIKKQHIYDILTFFVFLPLRWLRVKIEKRDTTNH